MEKNKFRVVIPASDKIIIGVMGLFSEDVFLAAKSKGALFVKAENTCACCYKKIKGYKVESGVLIDETLFRFSTMKLEEDLS